MTHITQHSIFCDECGEYLRDPSYLNNAPPLRDCSLANLRDTAARAGWVSWVDGPKAPLRHICKACKEKLGETSC